MADTTGRIGYELGGRRCCILQINSGDCSHLAAVLTALEKSAACTECMFCSVHDAECAKAKDLTPAIAQCMPHKVEQGVGQHFLGQRMAKEQQPLKQTAEQS